MVPFKNEPQTSEREESQNHPGQLDAYSPIQSRKWYQQHMEAIPNIRVVGLNGRVLCPWKTTKGQSFSAVNLGMFYVIETVRVGDVGRGKMKNQSHSKKENYSQN
ncbi:MAG: hypothetical protein AAB722_02130 [Patescibacteria group bacterium]